MSKKFTYADLRKMDDQQLLLAHERAIVELDDYSTPTKFNRKIPIVRAIILLGSEIGRRYGDLKNV